MLEDDVICNAEELGIVDDLYSMKRSGVNVIVAHSCNKFDLGEWEKSEYIFCDFGYNIPIGFLQREIIPVFKSRCLAKGISHDMLIAKAAVKLQARKLVMITNHRGVFAGEKLIPEISISKAKGLLVDGIVRGKISEQVEAAIFACKNGINRVHIISGQEQHSLLAEVFSYEGVGTMFYDKIPYKTVRRATFRDIATIKSIITTSFSISNIQIKKDIQFYHVVDIDSDIAGCMRVVESTGGVVVTFMLCDELYNQGVILKMLIEYLIELYDNKRILFDLSKNSVWIAIYPWFKKSGFKKASNKKLIYLRAKAD
jgi:amino-acid N-acetyltransferase